MSHRSAVTTHVLDTTRGRPAAGIAVRLSSATSTLDEKVTDADGRIGRLGPADLPAGEYQLTFETGTTSPPRASRRSTRGCGWTSASPIPRSTTTFRSC